jgi:serine/threonine protein phosphatase PrpC
MPDVTRVRLEEEGFLVMISDGVAEPSRDEWLMDLLAGWSGEDPQALAGLILTESIRREKLKDDCGVQVLYRPKSREKMVRIGIENPSARNNETISIRRLLADGKGYFQKSGRGGFSGSEIF